MRLDRTTLNWVALVCFGASLLVGVTGGCKDGQVVIGGDLIGGGAAGEGAGLTLGGGVAFGGRAGTGGTTSQQGCEGIPVSSTGNPLCQGELRAVLAAGRSRSDVFLMIDRSSSMARPLEGSTSIRRWDVVYDGVTSFVRELIASNSDVRVGIGFFGRSGHVDQASDCEVDTYATPEVDIGRSDQVQQALAAAIQRQNPAGFTPTRPALEGAHQVAAKAAVADPERTVSVVLLTDGSPTQCDGNTIDVGSVSAVAERALGTTNIRTFVVGMEGKGNLDAIARAGGTERALIVGVNQAGESTMKLTRALENATYAPANCELWIPLGDPASLLGQDVWVVHTPVEGPPERLPQVESQKLCNHGGWYFDDSLDPRSVRICPCSCARLDGNVTIDVCDPDPVPVPVD